MDTQQEKLSKAACNQVCGSGIRNQRIQEAGQCSDRASLENHSPVTLRAPGWEFDRRMVRAAQCQRPRGALEGCERGGRGGAPAYDLCFPHFM